MWRIARNSNGCHGMSCLIYSRDEPTIRKLCEVARIKLIEEMADSHPQYVDMHGYREEEVDEVLDDILDMVRSEFRKGNSLIQARRMANNTYCVVKIMTGKGRHSKCTRNYT